jgi:hypothetical protein
MQAAMSSDIFAQIESRFSPNHSEIGVHDPGARITAISTLDNGIDATRKFLCSLLTRRNAVMPISHLPPEILARVFHLLVLGEPPLSGKRGLGWIKVTYVCRHWRQVALEDSSLWAKIWGIPTITRWILELLVQAKNSPLDIKLGSFEKSTLEALFVILLHLSRARQLRFYGVSTHHSYILQQICDWEHWMGIGPRVLPVPSAAVGLGSVCCQLPVNGSCHSTHSTKHTRSHVNACKQNTVRPSGRLGSDWLSSWDDSDGRRCHWTARHVHSARAC